LNRVSSNQQCQMHDECLGAMSEVSLDRGRALIA
jgi:hypothetical protein